ncbi:MAG TPA: hypothetical protein VFU63_05285 [Ktedonobacterales bacterium]|nr:hypothetical protein [Ktedonobacterales bacterium]
MLDVVTIVGATTGILGIIIASGTMYYQRRQTQIMDAGLEKADTANEELDAPEADTGSQVVNKLRSYVNRRLRENRNKMKLDFTAQLGQIKQELQEHQDTLERHGGALTTLQNTVQGYENNVAMHQNTVQGHEKTVATLGRYLNDQKDIEELARDVRGIHAEVVTAKERIQAETGRYGDDIATHERAIQAIEQQLEDIRSGNLHPDTVRAQIRAVAQQLLQMTGQG